MIISYDNNPNLSVDEKLRSLIESIQLAIDTSATRDKLVSGINIKTINNQSLLGSGNINISGGSGGLRLEGTIADTQATSTTTTKDTINLPEGVWVVTVNVCFGNKTTAGGSTSTAAGNRSVILSTSDASYTGAQVASSSYAEAGKSVRVQATAHVEAGSDGVELKVRLYSANNCATTLGHWFATRVA